MTAPVNLMVLRQVAGLPPNVEAQLEERNLLIERDDGSKWINADQPLDAWLASMLVAHSGQFVVADQYGGFVGGPYRSLDKAEAARRSARVQLITEVEVDVEDGDDSV